VPIVGVVEWRDHSIQILTRFPTCTPSYGIISSSMNFTAIGCPIISGPSLESSVQIGQNWREFIASEVFCGAWFGMSVGHTSPLFIAQHVLSSAILLAQASNGHHRVIFRRLSLLLPCRFGRRAPASCRIASERSPKPIAADMRIGESNSTMRRQHLRH